LAINLVLLHNNLLSVGEKERGRREQAFTNSNQTGREGEPVNRLGIKMNGDDST
jgi:hypothetical protein